MAPVQFQAKNQVVAPKVLGAGSVPGLGSNIAAAINGIKTGGMADVSGVKASQITAALNTVGVVQGENVEVNARLAAQEINSSLNLNLTNLDELTAMVDEAFPAEAAVAANAEFTGSVAKAAAANTTVAASTEVTEANLASFYADPADQALIKAEMAKVGGNITVGQAN